MHQRNLTAPEEPHRTRRTSLHHINHNAPEEPNCPTHGEAGGWGVLPGAEAALVVVLLNVSPGLGGLHPPGGLLLDHVHV